MGSIPVNQGGGQNYWQPVIVNDGKNTYGVLARQVPEGTEGSVIRNYQLPNGEQRSTTELHLGGYYGRLVKMERFAPTAKMVEKKDNTDRIVLSIEDDEPGSGMKISMKITSDFALDFMSRFLNNSLNAQDKIAIKVFAIKNNDKEYPDCRMMIMVNENKITSPFTKDYQENPAVPANQKRPNWVKTPTPKGDMYDKRPQAEWLWFHCMNKMKAANPVEMSDVTFEAKQRTQTPQQPQQPAQQFGAPSQPQQPAQQFGAPSQPQQPAQQFGAPSQPQQPAQQFGAPAQPAAQFGAPSQPVQQFGAPAQQQPPQPTFGGPNAFGGPANPPQQYNPGGYKADQPNPLNTPGDDDLPF